jgi:ferredoxin
MSKRDGKSVLLNSTEKKGFWMLRIRDDETDINERAATACPVKVIEVR